MKKLTLANAALFLLLSVTSCTGSPTAKDDSKVTVQSTAITTISSAITSASTTTSTTTTTTTTIAPTTTAKKPTTTTNKPVTTTTVNPRGAIVNGTFTATDGSFHVNPPAGWTVQNNAGNIKFVAPDYTTTGSGMAVSVSAADNEIANLTKELFEEQMNSLLNLSIQCESLTHLTIDEHPAVYLRYSAVFADVPIHYYQYIVSTQHHSYSMTYAVLTPSSAMENAFAVSAKSFKEVL